MVSFILFNIYDFRPSGRKPTTFTVNAGEITSSKRYNNLNEGKDIAIKIKAGLTVHTSSSKVP
jgi:hypothetical protein